MKRKIKTKSTVNNLDNHLSKGWDYKNICISSWMFIVAVWFLIKFISYIFIVPSPLPTKILWPLHNRQILIIPKVTRSFVSNIICKLVMKTFYISTILSYMINRWLVKGTYETTTGVLPLKIAIPCVSNHQTQIYLDFQNMAIKISLVSKK